MNKKTIELIMAIFLIVYSIIVILSPLSVITDPKTTIIIMCIVYGVLSLVKNYFTYKQKDYEGLYAALACLFTIIVALFLNTKESVFNLVIIILTWISLLSFIKLKKSDYYHDNHNKYWKLKLVTLLLFVISGLLSSVYLYKEDFQIVVLGFFFYIHGILELIEPMILFILNKNK